MYIQFSLLGNISKDCTISDLQLGLEINFKKQEIEKRRYILSWLITEKGEVM